MVPELERVRVTELQVRMDCKGCVKRIKRAMHSVDGVFNVNIDLACQKLTVVGTADPEKIVEAIKKTRKIATICSPKEPGESTASEQPPPAVSAPSSSAPPASDAANQPPPTEPPKGEAPPQDNAPPEVKPLPEAKDAEPAEPKDVGAVRMLDRYPYDYIPKEQWNYCLQRHETVYGPPYYVSHGYSNYRALPCVPQDVRYIVTGAYDEDGYYHYRHRRGGDRSQMNSVFSEENPNACSIV